MIEDKCPTCPNYGKGYCDCGKSKTDRILDIAIGVALGFFSLFGIIIILLIL